MPSFFDELPPVQELEDQGRRLFGSELQRRPGDPPLEALTLRFEGIPGPGQLRWVATGLALFAVGAGLVFAWRSHGSPERQARAREERKQALLDEAVRLAEQEARGEIGPEYRQRQTEVLLTELAALLRQQDIVGSGGKRRQA